MAESLRDGLRVGAARQHQARGAVSQVMRPHRLAGRARRTRRSNIWLNESGFTGSPSGSVNIESRPAPVAPSPSAIRSSSWRRRWASSDYGDRALVEREAARTPAFRLRLAEREPFGLALGERPHAGQAPGVEGPVLPAQIRGPHRGAGPPVPETSHQAAYSRLVLDGRRGSCRSLVRRSARTSFLPRHPRRRRGRRRRSRARGSRIAARPAGRGGRPRCGSGAPRRGRQGRVQQNSGVEPRPGGRRSARCSRTAHRAAGTSSRLNVECDSGSHVDGPHAGADRRRPTARRRSPKLRSVEGSILAAASGSSTPGTSG